MPGFFSSHVATGSPLTREQQVHRVVLAGMARHLARDA